jgi:hypothetical protein
MELTPFGIQVIVIEPGNHRTPFASKVQLLKPEHSAYIEMRADLLPGLSRLGDIGADPRLAIDRIVETGTATSPRFVPRIGVDSEFFFRWRRSIEARAAAVRRIIGFPKKIWDVRVPR